MSAPAAPDARLSSGLPSHPKTKKLIRRVGEAGAWHLVCLILWARTNRPDGNLAGMSSEDIELAIDWRGPPDAFAQAAREVGFLDGAEGEYRLHDWAEHQPWSTGSDERSERARWKSLCRHHGRSAAAELMPEYAAKLARSTDSDADSNLRDADSNDAGLLQHADSTKSHAPSPNPNPSLRAEELSSLTAPGTSRPSAIPDLLGQAITPAADLPARRADRIRQIAEEAQAAFNATLAKPAGLLVAVRVMNGPRLKAVTKALPTIRSICKTLYGNERVTPQFWQQFFETAAADDWHAGRGPYRPPHENWRPDFEYLLGERVIAKLFERAMADADEDEDAA